MRSHRSKYYGCGQGCDSIVGLTHESPRIAVPICVHIVLGAVPGSDQHKNAGKLRKMNLQKLFGKTAFDKFVILGTGANKDEALKKYAGSGCWWIEDKPENAEAGLRVGLKPLLVEHGHNMSFKHDSIQKVKNWKEIYEIIVG